MEAEAGEAGFGNSMETAKYLLIAFCTGMMAVGPLAAQTPGPPNDTAPTSGQKAPMAQAAQQLSAPRAVQVDGLAVGDDLDPARLHVITRPGLYGLTRGRPGDRFGIVEGLLVRFDPATMRLKSIIRAGVTPVD